MPSRELTYRELQVLAWMIDHAASDVPALGDAPVEEADRARWRAQLATTRAGRPCGCGSCPSIELTDTFSGSPDPTKRRVVLGASTDSASLLLFIDDDQLSYLELASHQNSTFTEFPDPADIVTT